MIHLWLHFSSDPVYIKTTVFNNYSPLIILVLAQCCIRTNTVDVLVKGFGDSMVKYERIYL